MTNCTRIATPRKKAVHEELMTAYKKNVWAWVCVMGLLFALGLAGLYLSSWLFVPFLIIVVTAYQVFNRITCPSCGTPLTYEGDNQREGPFAKFGVPSAWFRTKCAKCHWDLNKNL